MGNKARIPQRSQFPRFLRTRAGGGGLKMLEFPQQGRAIRFWKQMCRVRVWERTDRWTDKQGTGCLQSPAQHRNELLGASEPFGTPSSFTVALFRRWLPRRAGARCFVLFCLKMRSVFNGRAGWPKGTKRTEKCFSLDSDCPALPFSDWGNFWSSSGLRLGSSPAWRPMSALDWAPNTPVATRRPRAQQCTCNTNARPPTDGQ